MIIAKINVSGLPNNPAEIYTTSLNNAQDRPARNYVIPM